jgi:peptide/nickel transport system permease protein
MGRGAVLRGVLHALATILFVVLFNFFLFRVVPGDPVTRIARAEGLTLAQREALAAEYGIDKPILEQLPGYIVSTITLDFGNSFGSGRPVTQEIGERIGKTALLVGVATLGSIVIGLLLGVYGAWRRGTAFDTGSMTAALLLYSVPEGWLSLVLLMVFGSMLGIFPIGGYRSTSTLTGVAYVTDVLNHLVLPAVALTLAYVGQYAIIMRSSLLDVMGEEYLVVARAKGVRDDKVLWRHAFPNAVLPIFTLIFYSFGYVVGGAVVVESIFSWPGLGNLTYKAIASQDFPVLQASFLLTSTSVILCNLAADLLYAYVDPRVRRYR